MAEKNNTPIEETKGVSIPDYTSYPREFISYRWFRPILTGVLFLVFHFIFQVILILALSFAPGAGFQRITDIVIGGYDSFDAYTVTGALLTLGSVALMIPALALANLIVGKRSFRSYSSSRGGWNHEIFFKCLLISVIVVSIPIIIDDVFIQGRAGAARFTLPGFILLTLLGPLQCIAEEYAFRGILMQAVGSWVRIPPLAIMITAAVFAAMHPYNIIGVIEIFISGCVFGAVAWAGHGIEVSSALHIANNMAIFYCVGFGFGRITSQETPAECIFSVTISLIYVAVIFICKKKGMFEKVKGNDAAEWNAKAGRKYALKAAGADETVTFSVPDETEVNAEEDRLL